MNLKQLKRKLKKRAPKAFKRAENDWYVKMIPSVSDLTFFILDQVDWKNKTIDGPEIEQEVFKLLAKVRRITQYERK